MTSHHIKYALYLKLGYEVKHEAKTQKNHTDLPNSKLILVLVVAFVAIVVT